MPTESREKPKAELLTSFAEPRGVAEVGTEKLRAVTQERAGVHGDESAEVVYEMRLVVETVVQRKRAQAFAVVLHHRLDDGIDLADLGEVLGRDADDLLEITPHPTR